MNNKHFSISNTLNKIIKLILCDAMANKPCQIFDDIKLRKHVTIEEENAFSM